MSTKPETTVTETVANPVVGEAGVIAIVSKGGNIARVIGNYATKKYKIDLFDGVAGLDDASATRVNCLSILVDALLTIETRGITGIIAIHTVSLVISEILSGHQYWVANGGKKRDGSVLSETEMSLWVKFAELYPKYMANIAIKPLPTQRQQDKNAKKTARDRDAEYDFLLQVTDEAWTLVEPAKATKIEGDGTGLAF